MTARQLFEYSLIELNKVEAPSLLLEDYNYFINKAILQYIDKRYNLYDMNQQTTDDLRVLKGLADITSLTHKTGNKLQGATYSAALPQDYVHLLNCMCEFTVSKPFKCYEPSEPFYVGAKRLTADMYSRIVNNYYMRPSYKNPYYYLHNETVPVVETNAPGTNDEEKPTGSRDANASPVTIEVRYGKDNTLFVLTGIQVEYLRAPQHIRLTQLQVDTDEDKSQILEFPDYVCQEIIKELVALLLENSSDPRLNSNIPVNQAIPSQPPGQPEQQGRRR